MRGVHVCLRAGRRPDNSRQVLTPDITRLQSGDPFMWETAFHFLWPVAWSAAHQRLQPDSFSPSDVEDVAVAAITEAAEQVAQVADFAELKTLTAVIAQRRAIDFVRRSQAVRRNTSATVSFEGNENLPDEEPNPLGRLQAAELARFLTGLMSALPRGQRKLLFGYYVQGKTQAELAAECGMPMGTVGVTLSRALLAMREELKKQPHLAKEFEEALR